MTEARYELSAYIGPCTRDEAERFAAWILADPVYPVIAVGVRPVDEDDPRYMEAVA